MQVAVVGEHVTLPVPGSAGLNVPGAAVDPAAGESQAAPPNAGRLMLANEAATQEFEKALASAKQALSAERMR